MSATIVERVQKIMDAASDRASLVAEKYFTAKMKRIGKRIPKRTLAFYDIMGSQWIAISRPGRHSEVLIIDLHDVYYRIGNSASNYKHRSLYRVPAICAELQKLLEEYILAADAGHFCLEFEVKQ